MLSYGMGMAADETDLKILGLLKGNARMNNTEIAKKTGISEASVRRRAARLAKEVIKRFTIELKSAGTGALIFIITTSETAKVATAIAAIKGVQDLAEISGDYDICAKVEAGSVGELNGLVDEIRKIKGIKKTKTFIILRNW